MGAAELGIGILGAVGGAAWAVRGRSSGVFCPNVWHGPRSSPSLTISFDDGPSVGTPKLLRVLEEYGVKATFFQCGANVEALPAIAREVVANGHELGNHTYGHPMLALKSAAFVAGEFRRGREAIHTVTGVDPKILRVPYGVRWFGLRQTGIPNIMWDVIGGDWKLPAKQVADRILRSARNGSILCLHDGRELNRAASIENTVEAVRWIVPALLQRGHTFRTITELIWTPPA